MYSANPPMPLNEENGSSHVASQVASSGIPQPQPPQQFSQYPPATYPPYNSYQPQYQQQYPYPPQQQNAGLQSYLLNQAYQNPIPAGMASVAEVNNILQNLTSSPLPNQKEIDILGRYQSLKPVIKDNPKAKEEKIPALYESLLKYLYSTDAPDEKPIKDFYLKGNAQYKKKPSLYADELINQLHRNSEYIEGFALSLELWHTDALELVKAEKDEGQRKFLKQKVDELYERFKASIGDPHKDLNDYHTKLTDYCEKIITNVDDVKTSVESKFLGYYWIMPVITFFLNPKWLTSFAWRHGNKKFFVKILAELKEASTPEEKEKALKKVVRYLAESYSIDHIYRKHPLNFKNVRQILDSMKENLRSPAEIQKNIEEKAFALKNIHDFLTIYPTYKFTTDLKAQFGATGCYVLRYDPNESVAYDPKRIKACYTKTVTLIRYASFADVPNPLQPGEIFLQPWGVSIAQALCDARREKSENENKSKLNRIKETAQDIYTQLEEKGLHVPIDNDIPASYDADGQYNNHQRQKIYALETTIISLANTDLSPTDVQSINNGIRHAIQNYERMIDNYATQIANARANYITTQITLFDNFFNQCSSLCELVTDPANGLQTYKIKPEITDNCGSGKDDIMANINTHLMYLTGCNNIDTFLNQYYQLKQNPATATDIITAFRPGNMRYFDAQQARSNTFRQGCRTNISSLERIIDGPLRQARGLAEQRNRERQRREAGRQNQLDGAVQIPARDILVPQAAGGQHVHVHPATPPPYRRDASPPRQDRY